MYCVQTHVFRNVSKRSILETAAETLIWKAFLMQVEYWRNVSENVLFHFYEL